MDNFSRPGNPQSPYPQLSLEDLDFKKITRFLKLILPLVLIILLWKAISWAQRFYVDWLWFGSLGYEDVLIKIMTARILLFLTAAVVFIGLAAPSLYYAHRAAGLMKASPANGLPAGIYDSARKLLLWVAGVVLVLAAVFLAAQPASNWESYLRYLNGVAFNETDPIFQKDFSFYIFTLPALELARTWLLTVVVFTLFFAGAFYYITLTIRGERFTLSGAIKKHLVLLAAVAFVLVAAGHWLSRYELLYSPTGAVFGVGYTDENITLPARALMTFVALVTAGLLVAAARSRGNRLIYWALGGWIGLNLLGGTLLPALVQRLHVEPSELAREKPYLANNIEFTRRAYGLTQLQSKNHPARGAIDRETIAENQGTIQNIRLWDEGPLLQSYNQIQFFRLYYDFMAVHTDRYLVDDELRQVMLATRELSPEKLPEEAQRWVNRHLQFTHGYGVAMSPVTEVEAGGRPSFFIRDVPPRGKIDLQRPEIYYGLNSLPYVIARSQMEEFNYPGPDGPVYNKYDGKGGVRLDSFLRRILYAWEFADINILISGEINPDSLIQYRRTIQERFAKVTPFLLRDREAYSVVADGRLYWMQDAYTFTSRYPYSTPWNKTFNYLRNSVKAVVDAYHGSIDYYVSDPSDPMIQTYQAIFPGLFKPMDQMPSHLRDHIRYPLDQFTVQTEMLLQYHMEDPVVFYNKEDQWSIPIQNSFGESQPLKPYYLVGRLPGESEEEFLLIQPFTPQNRHNLVGWMAARSDGKNYGELVLFDFPTGRHVDGPNQVEARIDNDAVISEQFTLWGQVGSEVSRGILLVIPIGDSILYAEPIFLKPETLEFPELRRIILADSKQVVMHQTLNASIDALVGRVPAVESVSHAEDARKPREEAPSGDRLEAARQALKKAIESLQEVLENLK